MPLAQPCRLFALLAALSLTAASASAAEFINIDFESDTPGLAPAVDLTPDNPMTKPSAIGGYTPLSPPAGDTPPTAGSGTIAVGSAPGMAQGAIMTTNPLNGELGALWVDNNGFNVAAQKIRMSFDVNIVAAPTEATAQPKTLNGGTAGIILGMNTAVSNGPSVWAFRFAAAPTSATGGVFAFRTPDNSELIDFFNYVEGTTYNVAIEADYGAGKLDAFVDGNLALSDYAFWNIGAPNVTTGEFFFHLNGEVDSANIVGLDNIRASVIPEPASAALAGAAALRLFVVRRRRLCV